MPNISETRQCSAAACVEDHVSPEGVIGDPVSESANTGSPLQPEAGQPLADTTAGMTDTNTYQSCGCDKVFGNLFAVTSLVPFAVFGGFVQGRGNKRSAGEMVQVHLNRAAEFTKKGRHYEAGEELRKAGRQYFRAVRDVPRQDLLARVIFGGTVVVQTTPLDPSGAVRLLRDAAEEFIKAGAAAEAIGSLNLALDGLGNFGDPKIRGEIYARLADVYHELNEPLNEAQMYSKHGRMLQRQEKFVEAAGLFSKCRDTIQALIVSRGRIEGSIYDLYEDSVSLMARSMMSAGLFKEASKILDNAQRFVSDRPNIFHNVSAPYRWETAYELQTARTIYAWFDAVHDRIEDPRLEHYWSTATDRHKAMLVQDIMFIMAAGDPEGRSIKFDEKKVREALSKRWEMTDHGRSAIDMGRGAAVLVSQLKASLKTLAGHHRFLTRDVGSDLAWSRDGLTIKLNLRSIRNKLEIAKRGLETVLSKIADPAKKFDAIETVWLSVRNVRDTLWDSGCLRSERQIQHLTGEIRRKVAQELGINENITAKAIRDARIRLGPPPERLDTEGTARVRRGIGLVKDRRRGREKK